MRGFGKVEKERKDKSFSEEKSSQAESTRSKTHHSIVDFGTVHGQKEDVLCWKAEAQDIVLDGRGRVLEGGRHAAGWTEANVQ